MPNTLHKRVAFDMRHGSILPNLIENGRKAGCGGLVISQSPIRGVGDYVIWL